MQLHTSYNHILKNWGKGQAKCNNWIMKWRQGLLRSYGWCVCVCVTYQPDYVLPMIVHKGYKRCDSACCDLAFAKPNPMINTDLLIISSNYLSLICETEILCLPHFYLKHQFLYRISLIWPQKWPPEASSTRGVYWSSPQYGTDRSEADIVSLFHI